MDKLGGTSYFGGFKYQLVMLAFTILNMAELLIFSEFQVFRQYSTSIRVTSGLVYTVDWRAAGTRLL